MISGLQGGILDNGAKQPQKVTTGNQSNSIITDACKGQSNPKTLTCCDLASYNPFVNLTSIDYLHNDKYGFINFFY